MTTKKSDGVPVIICVGEHGRAVVYGRAEREPEIGQPCRLTGARMILYWSAECGGLFGLAACGPRAGTRITHAIPSTSAIPAQTIVCTAEAARAIEEWPAHE